jgi:hypothetical protein
MSGCQAPGTSNERALAALATRPSATEPRRLDLRGRGFKLGDGKSEIRNPKSEILRGGRAPFLIPNS